VIVCDKDGDWSDAERQINIHNLGLPNYLHFPHVYSIQVGAVNCTFTEKENFVHPRMTLGAGHF